MVLESPRSGKTSFPPVPLDWPDPILGDESEVVEQQVKQSREWQHKVAEVVNGILDGRVNCTGNLTLAVDSLFTVVRDRRCGIGSVVTLQATSGSSGGELGVYVSNTGVELDGIPTFTINHAFDSRTDRTFRYTIFGTSTVEDFTTGTETVPGPMAIARVAMNGSTGTQEIIVPGFGTPTAALFIVGEGRFDVGDPDLHTSFGATDGTNQWVVNSLALDASATTSTWRRGATDEVIQMVGSTGFMFLEANFDSWVTDGVRINITSTDAVGRAMIVVLFGGSITAKVGTATLATENNTTTVTPGLEAEALIVASTSGALNDTTTTNGAAALGFGSWDGSTIRQSSFGYIGVDAQAAGDPRSQVRNDAVFARPNSVSYAELSNITSTQFDLTSRAADLSGKQVGYLALNLGGGEAWAGTLDSPTSTGNNAWTGVGFKPILGLLIPNMMTTLAANTTNAEAGAFGFSAFTSTAEFCNAWSDEDAADPTNTQSISNPDAINLDADDGTDAFDATFASFDADGATLNFSTVDDTTRKWPALFIKA